MGNLRRQWSELAFEKKLSIVFVPVLIALIGIAVPVLQLASGDDEAEGERPPRADARLEVVDLAVTHGRLDVEPRVTQRIDLTVRNLGQLVSIVKRVGMRVRDAGFVAICQGGGGLDASKRYDVLLPPRATAGQLLESKVSQEIEPGAADRFVLKLDVPEPDRQLGHYLYQLDVLLEHDTAKEPMDAGTVLVSAPYLPVVWDFWSARKDEGSFQGAGAAEVRRCLQDNEATFRRMIALEGERSPELSEQLLVPPSR
jgi:hypothetical protein